MKSAYFPSALQARRHLKCVPTNSTGAFQAYANLKAPSACSRTSTAHSFKLHDKADCYNPTERAGAQITLKNDVPAPPTARDVATVMSPGKSRHSSTKTKYQHHTSHYATLHTIHNQCSYSTTTPTNSPLRAAAYSRTGERHRKISLAYTAVSRMD